MEPRKKKEDPWLVGVLITVIVCSVTLWIVVSNPSFRSIDGEAVTLSSEYREDFAALKELEEEEEAVAVLEEDQEEIPPVCVLFHLGTRSEWPYYVPLLGNVNHIPHDLYITVAFNDWDPMADCETLEKYKSMAMELLKPEFNLDAYGHRVFILPMENRGLDGGGFLVAIDEILRKKRNYKYMLKLHSKTNRNPWVYNWRGRLLEPILSSPQQVDRCLAILDSEPKVGMLGSAPFIHVQHRNDTKLFAEMYNLPFHPYNQPSRFVGGTMFWVRFDIMAFPFREAHANAWYIYRDAPHGYPPWVEWTGHLLERLYGDWVELKGYEIRAP